MGRRRSSTRSHPKARPRGPLSVTAAGSGFVKTSEGEFFIPRSVLGDAFDGDIVEVRPTSRRGHDRRSSSRASEDQRARTGRVVSVITRAHETLVGRYEVAEPFGIVVPLDPRLSHDIFTRRGDHPEIADGSIVRVRITAYPTRSSAACGVIEEVLESLGDIDTEVIFDRFSLPRTFGIAALEEAAAEVCDVTDALARGYRDLRERPYVTIDPPDARDFDDAIVVERLEGPSRGRWRLGVAIADVSSYVREGGPLDLEGRERACSVYLADRAVPMLPERLSNDLCSLRPDADRLVVNVDLVYDEDYERLSQEIHPAVIRSRAALTYDRVLELLEGAPAKDAEQSLAPMLSDAAALAAALERARVRRGGLEFSTVEAKARLDAEGSVVAIDLRRKTAATTLVESAMIEANEAVARWMEARRAPMLYRIHERPDADALAGLAATFSMFPWFDPVLAAQLAGGKPQAFQEVLTRAAGRAEETLVTTLALRAQQRARYSPENLGHFGLGAPVYTHFTSPIRRYPDLVVHRRVKAALDFDGDLSPEGLSLAAVADYASFQERRAEEAARASQEQKMARFMAGHIGEDFEGVIEGVATYGLYVRLDLGPEGLVRASTLPEGPYRYQPSEHRLIGFKERRSYRLGQRVRVRVAEVDLERFQIRLTSS